MKKKLLVLIVSLLLLGGCITTGGDYVGPVVDDPTIIADSEIMRITGNDPSTLGKVIRTGFWAVLVQNPLHAKQARSVIENAQAMLKDGVTFMSLMAYLQPELNILNSIYTVPLLIWMPNMDLLGAIDLPIGEYDTLLIQKNLNDLTLILDGFPTI